MAFIKGLRVPQLERHQGQQVVTSRLGTIHLIEPIPLATRRIAPITATRIAVQAEVEAAVVVGSIAAIRAGMEAILAIRVGMEVTLGVVGIRVTEGTRETVDIQVATVVALHLGIRRRVIDHVS